MKGITATLILLLLTLTGTAQPGDIHYPRPINLDEYPGFPRDMDANGLAGNFHANSLGEITIDSSSDLSLIPFLRKEKSLSIRIALPTIPSAFYQFRYTEDLVLSIDNDSTDISFLNEFRHLKTLQLNISGTMTFSDYLRLDSLSSLSIQGPKLTSVEAFKKINSITELSLDAPLLVAFPIFEGSNQIQHVWIGQSGDDNCETCPPNLHKIDLSSLSSLQELQSLYLHHINGLTAIPTNWSQKLRVLTINGGLRHDPEFATLCYLDDLKPLVIYENLETIEITEVHLKKITGDYSRLPLERVKIEVFGLEDKSGFDSFPKGTTNNGQFECEPLHDIGQTLCKLFWTRTIPEKPYYNGFEFWR